ncbi:methionine aminopeptidase [Cytobacillus purgationiresistens]|uniref:Metal-binding protein n=1 Tax=Cytobacillus purgationiresistens TaxID=863449 RepID=A0ABU0AAC4_9BACI|nr:methionine aminopeptidase [Cytobacillus purgationiresistens]MDQ0268196.1 putative metal-binding protein [Cytobacillus purgationiresistens]
MGLFQAFNEWKASMNEKHVSKMKELDKCPDCRGRGFPYYPGNEYMFLDDEAIYCASCEGSGLYSAWENQQIE